MRNLAVGQKIYNSATDSAIYLTNDLVFQNIFYFEDYLEMVKDWKNVDFDTTRLVLLKIQEIGVYTNRVEEVRMLSLDFQNAGPYSWIAMQNDDCNE